MSRRTDSWIDSRAESKAYSWMNSRTEIRRDIKRYSWIDRPTDSQAKSTTVINYIKLFVCLAQVLANR